MTLRIALPLILAGAAMAQGPMGPGRRMGPGLDAVKDYLGLTDAQVQSIQQARQRAGENARTTFEQIRTKQTALRDLLDKGTTDAAAVGKLTLEIEALRKQAKEAMSGVRTQSAAQLTAAQAAKLKSLEEAAELQPALHGAMALGLLEPPDAPAHGMGMGPGMMGSPAMMHRGPRRR